MTSVKNAVGAYGERRAVAYLTAEAGMWVLERNWRCAEGEVDLVCRDGDTIVFVEVKTRRSGRFGAPVEALVPDKVERLRRLASLWLAEHRPGRVDVRFDVVSVWRPLRGRALVDHVRGAF
ncbi:UPF0102 protein [Virgisporangium aliadipatigenens]|uniref:UPF0102 protein Val02_27100 n=1 Tax=Virgisporangium aliadipatigenens TaxID=741659 RepID=A0A8J3YIB0_9ACTN|nr:YraN family protein [Virgisporangium aliadipatigenens]GIJ45824.1 UPF0102 protein [Virgisporangium aliadipatigenens]